MPTLMNRSRPNLRGRLILRRLFDAAQQPTEPHNTGWIVDAGHDDSADADESHDDAKSIANSPASAN